MSHSPDFLDNTDNWNYEQNLVYKCLFLKKNNSTFAAHFPGGNN
jgi:hypothetical protein